MHLEKVVSLKTVIMLLVLTLGLSACEMFRLKAIYAESLEAVEQSKKTHQAVVQQQAQQVDKTTERLKLFYMTCDERLWGDIAEYEAKATLEAAKAHDVSVTALVGVVTSESQGYPFAKSGTGAKGPGQVDFAAHKEEFPHIKEERDKYDPKKNIDCAASLLSRYIKKYGLRNALHAYNLGEPAFKKGRRNPGYVKKVLRNMQKYRNFHE